MGWSPGPMRSVLTPVSVRTEWDRRTPMWCHRECLGMGKKAHMSGVRKYW